MPQANDSVQNEQIESALDNLRAIKNDERIDRGRTANGGSVTPDDIVPRDELTYRHDEIVRDRDQINDDFVAMVNLIEPSHPFTDDPYPISLDDVRLSYCKESSSTWARCGPMYDHNDDIVQFSADRKTMGRMVTERYYNVLVHELTHITEGSHNDGSPHNPRFWRTVADHAVTLIAEWPRPFDTEAFVSYVRHEPNNPMTDKRMMTVDEQRQAVEDRILSQL